MRGAPERIRTTHVGSLVRPPDLVALAERARNGDAAAVAVYEERLREAVDDVVRRQASTGLDIINDGEFGKSAWHAYMNERLTGFELQPSKPVEIIGQDARDFPEFYAQQNIGLPQPRPAIWVITGPVAYAGEAAIRRDIADLQTAVEGVDVEDVFMAAVAPGSVARYRSDYYATEEEALFAVATALRSEYRAIVDAGFVLQVDDAHLAVMYDNMVPPATLEEYRRWAQVRVDAVNHALEGLPRERTRYHLCWGSWNAPHVSDVELKHIVDLVLQIRVGGFAFEMANPRHEHEWRLWDSVKLPPDCVLIPGVVGHATNVVEHPELVCERIVRLAKLVGRENVVAGTDCGFAQVATLQRVHPSVMWAKLGAMVEGARLATQALWG